MLTAGPHLPVFPHAPSSFAGAHPPARTSRVQDRAATTHQTKPRTIAWCSPPSLLLRFATVAVCSARPQAVTGLCPLQGRMFAYSLASGAVGVYEGRTRLWQSAAKVQATAIAALDVNLDGVSELVCGWADGRVDVRDGRTGSVMLSDAMPAPVAGMARCSYKRDSMDALIVCATNGQLHGYQPAGAAEESPDGPAGLAETAGVGGGRAKRSRVALEALQQSQAAHLDALRRSKQDLMLNLNRVQKMAGFGGSPAQIAGNVDLVTQQVTCTCGGGALRSRPALAPVPVP